MENNREFGGENPELSALENIIPKENLDSNLTFKLENEKDAEGNQIPGQAFWLKLESAKGQAEGKLYLPESGKSENLILFEPGMPGDSVKWMEERYVSKLASEGSSVIVMRHLGTRLDSEATDKYIHSPERVQKNPNGYSQAVGNLKEAAKIQSMANEAATALNILGKKFSKIKVIGHSMGALFLSHSINKLDPDVLNKISHFLCLAGVPAGLEESKLRIADYKGYLQKCQDYIRMEEPDKVLQGIDEINNNLKAKGIPDNVMVTMVQSPDDEYLNADAGKEFQEIFRKGLNIQDLTQTESEFHDLKNLRPETLIRLLNLSYVPGKKSNASLSRKNPFK